MRKEGRHGKKTAALSLSAPHGPHFHRPGHLSAFRLNLGFFFRQLCIFVVLDLLLAGMALCGLILYGENRCADVAALVEERGVPTPDALAWMEASDYTITLLDGEPTG